MLNLLNQPGDASVSSQNDFKKDGWSLHRRKYVSFFSLLFRVQAMFLLVPFSSQNFYYAFIFLMIFLICGFAFSVSLPCALGGATGVALLMLYHRFR